MVVVGEGEAEEVGGGEDDDHFTKGEWGLFFDDLACLYGIVEADGTDEVCRVRVSFEALIEREVQPLEHVTL